MKAINIQTIDPALNLAIEETLFETLYEGHPGYFLLWQNTPSVIIGRHQNAWEEVNIEYTKNNNIPIVRRGTGGGAVYHDLGNLNFSFLSWMDTNELGFERYLKPIKATLRELGIDAELSSRNDITVDGKKVSGNAQRKSGKKLLQHGTLLVNLDTSNMGDILTGNPEKYLSKGVSSHKSRVTNLINYFHGMSANECMSTLREKLLENCASETIEIDVCVEKSAYALAENKYRTWEWNFGQSPKFTNKISRRFSWGAIDCCLDVKKGYISRCYFFGDYFAHKDIEALEALFIGITHTREALLQALGTMNPEDFIKFK